MATPHFFVTGSPGIGKTTLIIEVLEKLRLTHPGLKVQGFFTREIRKEGERTGFEVITVNGTKDLLASIDAPQTSGRSPMVGRYKVNVPGFEVLALPELQVRADTQLFIIDEIGKMELFSGEFFPAVEAVLRSNTPVLGSVPLKHSSKQVDAVVNLPSTKLFTLDRKNRDELASAIFNALNCLLIKVLGRKTMHPPLILHKHPQCAEEIIALIRCHDDHPVAKFWGKCNDVKLHLVRCFQEEKVVKRNANFEKGKEFQEKLRAHYAELRARG